MRQPTKEYFAETIWWTPNQIRDSFLDYSHDLTTEFIQNLKSLAIDEQARRKSLPEMFIECPFCKGYHGQCCNIDGLCEKHEAEFAPMRYDSKA